MACQSEADFRAQTERSPLAEIHSAADIHAARGAEFRARDAQTSARAAAQLHRGCADPHDACRKTAAGLLRLADFVHVEIFVAAQRAAVQYAPVLGDLWVGDRTWPFRGRSSKSALFGSSFRAFAARDACSLSHGFVLTGLVNT